MKRTSKLALTAAALAALTAGMWSASASNAPVATVPAPTDYVPLGTSSFGPNNHGSYAWFIDAKTKQVVMCLVHNPQSPIECKRAPMPPG